MAGVHVGQPVQLDLVADATAATAAFDEVTHGGDLQRLSAAGQRGLAQTRMLTIEPGGGSRSVARASVAATVRAACAAVTLGVESSRAACATVGFGRPASAASKKAFCAVARASL